MRKLMLLIIPIIMLNACMGGVVSYDEGVKWEKYVFGDIEQGIELNDELIFFSDDDSDIYAIWKRTQGQKWKRSLSNQTITTLYSAGDELYVISHTEGATGSTFWAYDTDEGELRTNFSLPIIPQGKYMTYTNRDDEHKLIVHSEYQIASIEITNMKFEVRNLDSDSWVSSDGVGAVVFARTSSIQEYLLVITKKSRVLKMDDLSDTSPGKYNAFDTSPDFYGSAVYYDGYLYIGDTSGIQIMTVDNGMWLSGEDDPVKYPNLKVGLAGDLYAALQNYPHAGLAKYTIDDATGRLSEEWTYDTIYDVTYGSLVISEGFFNIGSFLDDTGDLHNIDLNNGNLIFEKALGKINNPNLKFAYDENEGVIFIPLDVPSKIVCYSLEWVLGQKVAETDTQN